VNAMISLEEYLAGADTEAAIAATVVAIAKATVGLSVRISRGSLDGHLAATLGTNIQGEDQKHLDVVAHDAVIDALRPAPVAAVLSEESDEPEILDLTKPLAVAVDPLDGSANIDINAPIGTIFSVLPANPEHPAAAFLQPGSAQVAAGYVIYGAQTQLALTTGKGTHLFTLDRATGTYFLTHPATVGEQTTEFAINLSNYRHWDDAIRHFVDDCLDGDEGPLGKNYNMRWLAAVAGEAHRILQRGGLFLYPVDRRAGYRNGRLRLVYEANPIAMLMEQAGGAAIDGHVRIMDIVPKTPHQRTGLIFGSAAEVRRLGSYVSRGSHAHSPLFGQRGLFRS
jgi:fructose-1,6-bisphosphatase I